MNKRNETTERERQKEEHTVPDMNKRTEKEEKEPTSTYYYPFGKTSLFSRNSPPSHSATNYANQIIWRHR